ncbi:gag-protease polyprotein, partial [Trifolium pratense]
PNGKGFTQDTRKGSGIPRRPKTDDKPSQNKGIQCHECEGYGHVRAECPTYLKNQKKSLTASWSDDELSDNEGNEAAKQITALTGICASETDSCEEELTYDELADSYRELCLKSEEVCRTLEKQKETISKLQTEKHDNISKMNALQEKVNNLTSDLEEAKHVIDKLNTDNSRLRKFSDMLYKDDNHIEGLHKADERLEEILEKNVLKPRHIGLSYEKVNKLKGYDPNLMYTQPKGTQTAKVFKQKFSHSKQHQGNRSRGRTHHWVCHYCGRRGHIRPFCYKLYGYPERKSQPRPVPIQKK